MHTQGYFDCDYKTIKSIFGEPEKSVNNEDRAMWHIVFKNGTFATIYDWRTTGPISKIFEWHIGGDSEEAVFDVVDEIQRRKGKTLLGVALAWPSRGISVKPKSKITKKDSNIKLLGTDAKKYMKHMYSIEDKNYILNKIRNQ
jgi:hypothetical protein